MGRDLAQLHLRHDGRPQGRRLSSSRRESAGGRQCRDRRHGPRIPSISGRCRCSIATAGVSRGRSASRRERMSASGRCAPPAHLRSDRRARVTHLCGAPIVMQILLNAAPQRGAPSACRALLHRRRPAARRRAGGDERRRLRGDASLRPDRDLWPGRRQRLEGGMERADGRRAGGAEVAPGRALSRARSARRDRSRDDGARARRTARRWAK